MSRASNRMLRNRQLVPTNPSRPSKFLGAGLYLDFIRSSKSDPRITFTRGSNATVTGANGVLQYAPHNLLAYSEQFDNAAWQKSGATVTANTLTAPDGSATVDKIVEDTSNAEHYVRSSTVSCPAGTYVASVYWHTSSERSLYLRVVHIGDTSATSQVIFDKSTLTLGPVSGNGVSASAKNVGDGWWRISLVFSITATRNVQHGCQLITTTSTYTGNGTSGIFVWGAQLNVGDLQPYYPTTVKNLLGYTQEFDNAAWTKSNSFVQTNQIRNNTMQGAVAGTPGTLPTNWSGSTAGNGVTREIIGTGVEGGVNYIDVRVYGTPTASLFFGLRFDASTYIAAVNGQTWTSSVYLKLIGGSLTNISAVKHVVSYNDSAGTGLTYSVSSTTPTSQPLNSQRLTVTGAASNASTAYVINYLQVEANAGVAIDITLRIGLPQLVLGSSAGDAVATYGTARAVMYTAPDGSMSADKLMENNTNSIHRAEQFPTLTDNSILTWSCYIKAAERSFTYLEGRTKAGTFPGAFFNLSNGTVGTTVSGASAAIQAIGSGWYRCSISFNVSTGASSPYVGVQSAIGSSAFGDRSYLGDGTSGIYIWGAQLSDSASLDPYVYNPGAAPSAAAYYGPRFDYDPVTLQPNGLLIEEQRTNLCLYSKEIDSALYAQWQFGIGVTPLLPSGTIAAPDGTMSGKTYTLVANNPSTGYQVMTVTANTVYTWSLYVRLGTLPLSDYKIAFRDDTAGVFIAADVVPTLIPVGDGWSRLTYTLTTPAGCVSLRCYPIRSLNVATGGTVSFWGAQLEAGAFPTSYIPTTTAAATRAADVATMTGTNFSSWYNQTEGTLFGDSTFEGTLSASTYGGVIAVSSANNTRMLFTNNPSNAAGFYVQDGGVVQADLNAGSTFTIGVPYKQAGAYKANDFAWSRNGVAALTDTSGSVPAATALQIGGLYYSGSGQLGAQHIRRIAYYPRRLTNAELQAITA